MSAWQVFLRLFRFNGWSFLANQITWRTLKYRENSTTTFGRQIGPRWAIDSGEIECTSAISVWGLNARELVLCNKNGRRRATQTKEEEKRITSTKYLKPCISARDIQHVESIWMKYYSGKYMWRKHRIMKWIRKFGSQQNLSNKTIMLLLFVWNYGRMLWTVGLCVLSTIFTHCEAIKCWRSLAPLSPW